MKKSKLIFESIKNGVIKTSLIVGLAVVYFIAYGLHYSSIRKGALEELESKKVAEESSTETAQIEVIEETQETEDFFEIAQ